jgi:hypothetical protein
MSSLFAGLLFSTIGIWLLREAKKRANLRLIPIAILLIGYSYFTPKPIYDWGVGILLCVIAYKLWE